MDIISFEEFKIYEDGEGGGAAGSGDCCGGDGGGTAYSTLGNTSGIGNVVAPQPGYAPGEAGADGSGDVVAGKKVNNLKKKKKKKKKADKYINNNNNILSIDSFVESANFYKNGPDITPQPSKDVGNFNGSNTGRIGFEFDGDDQQFPNNEDGKRKVKKPLENEIHSKSTKYEKNVDGLEKNEKEQKEKKRKKTL